VPLVFRKVLDRLANVHAGVVDQDVHAATTCMHFRQGSVDASHSACRPWRLSVMPNG
jgi:hypothetical protein